MKGMLKGFAALALATVFATSTANAQGMQVGIGGTALFNLDSDASGTDFGVMAKIGSAPASGIGFRLDVTGIFNDAPGTGLIVGLGPTYTFMTSETSMFKPYLLAQLNVFTSTEGLTDDLGDKLGAAGGAGFNYQMSSVNLFAEAIFTYMFEDAFGKPFRVNAGVAFPLGGN